MNDRQRKKELKKFGVNLNDAYKNPIEAVQRAAAIIAGVYQADNSPITKIAVQLEVERLNRLFKQEVSE